MFAFCSIERGMGMGRTKLTVEQVLEARLRYASGEREYSKLARDFGVSREAIRNAIDGLTFKYLPMPPKKR
jgi:DNA-binding GntR family transcriptional regulator